MPKNKASVPLLVRRLFLTIACFACIITAFVIYTFGLGHISIRTLYKVPVTPTANEVHQWNSISKTFNNADKSTNSQGTAGKNVKNNSAKTSVNPVLEMNDWFKHIFSKDITSGIKPVCNLTRKERFLVVSPPLGRLGNLMFQLASTFGIASAFHFQFVIPPKHPIVEFFDVDRFVLPNVPSKTEYIKDDSWISMVQRNDMGWLCRNISLQGHLQNYKYFSHIENVVRNLFMFKPTVLKSAKTYLATKIPNLATKIGIQVRRGDFLKSKGGRVVANSTFISKAMDFFRSRFPRVHFIVCSDDIQWCRKNILTSEVTFSVFKDPVIDLAILSLCDHTIITVGTFSWWAGFLSGGTVVYLNDYPVPGSILDRFAPKDIYYPPEWIGLDNSPVKRP